ncbi:hypothetical protein PRZ48_004209 [Zasmidium cellare]|uniref:DUF6590 domain-containing protein n=1 Tax=Zasmidium cellare TaxID=395010 RepID=A0ABR0EX67_ZASCE|nr:hypothetical protein PRZ48_004209 [Zasmidium cellare]
MESSRWQWDPSRQQYYHVDVRTREYVFQDGSRLPLRVAASYGATTSGPQSLTEGLSALQLEYPGARTVNPYPFPQQEPQSLTRALGDSPAAVPSNPGDGQKQLVSAAQRYGISEAAPGRLGTPVARQSFLEPMNGDLYQNYRVRKHGFFCIGRVFLVLWVEPAGGSVNSSSTSLVLGQGQHNERVFSKVRRFVVIREGNTYCSAVPITTYGGQGVAKRGVAKDEHAIIYTGREPPSLAPQEMPGRTEMAMRPIAIRVVPDDKAETLDPYSRIDFGKVHTIQHNIKVRPFGKVHASSMIALHAQFQQVWTNSASGQPKATGSQSSKGAQVDESTRDPRRTPGTQTGSSRVASGNSVLAEEDMEDEDGFQSDPNGSEHHSDDDDDEEDEDEDAYYTEARGGLTPPHGFR